MFLPGMHTYKFTRATTTVPRGEAPPRCWSIAVLAVPGPSVPHATTGEREDVVAAGEKRQHMLVET